MVFLLAYGLTVAQNPSKAPKSFGNTGLTVRVLRVNWTILGCNIEGQTDSGGSYPADSTFTVSAHLVNKNLTSACNMTVVLAGTGYSLANPNITVLIPADGSGTAAVAIQAPDFASPEVLTLTLQAVA